MSILRLSFNIRHRNDTHTHTHTLRLTIWKFDILIEMVSRERAVTLKHIAPFNASQQNVNDLIVIRVDI